MSAILPNDVRDYIRQAYRRYYDSAFWLRDSKILAERGTLVDSDGAISQEVLLEAVLPYPSTQALKDVCLKLGLSEATADELGRITFENGSKDFKIRDHQAEALLTSLSSG